MAGYDVTKASLNNRMGSNIAALFGVMADILKIKAWLDTQTTQNLLDMTFTQAEADNIKSSYNDLQQLVNVFYGTSTQQSAVDFRTFPQRLIGINQF